MIDQFLGRLPPRCEAEIRFLAVLKCREPDAQIDLAAGNDFIATATAMRSTITALAGKREQEDRQQRDVAHQKACPIEKKN